MEFAVTPTGQVGLVTKKFPDGTFELDIWDREEAYYGEASIQANPVHPDVDKFRKAIEAIKAMGGRASFF